MQDYRSSREFAIRAFTDTPAPNPSFQLFRVVLADNTYTRTRDGRRKCERKPSNEREDGEMTSMQAITAEGRRRMIAEAAWHRAEARGFANGDPMLDWLEAEREIDALLTDGRTSWLGKLEDRLATARGEIRSVKSEVGSRAKSARKSAKVRLKQDIEKMDELLDRFEEQIGKLRERGEKATQKARAQAEKIWDEIQELRQRVVGKQS